MTGVKVLPEWARFMGGAGISPLTHASDVGKGIDPSVHMAFKFRVIEKSRDARNKFAIEIGPTMGFVTITDPPLDITAEANFIYKINKLFGAGVLIGTGARRTRVLGKNEWMYMNNVGLEAQIYKDIFRIRGGIAVVKNDWDKPNFFAHIVFDFGLLASQAIGLVI